MNSPDAQRLNQDYPVLLEYWNLGGDTRALAHFGLEGHEQADSFLALLQAIGRNQLQTAQAIMLQMADSPGMLVPLDRVAQCLYKILTMVSPGAATNVAKALASQALIRHPGNPEAEHLALEFLLYFGYFDLAEKLLALSPADRHMPQRAALRRGRSRLSRFEPRTRVSYCILTWNRAELLDRCLTELRAQARCQDYEIIVGVNASTDATAEVLARHGIEKVLWNVRNDSIDYYRDIMDAATGEYLVEVDDNVVEFPPGFDEILLHHLQAFPEFAYLGIEPTRLSLASGRLESMNIGDNLYTPCQADGLTVHQGPVWGCCAMIANRDYRRIHGLYGVRLSKDIGEEPQFIRKLLAHERKSGLLMGHRLVKAYS